MIFRRFLPRLKQHQWGAILTELVIVIIGVFIGMQVSNWNEERETDRKAVVFTERLRTDLQKEAWNYEYLGGLQPGNQCEPAASARCDVRARRADRRAIRDQRLPGDPVAIQ